MNIEIYIINPDTNRPVPLDEWKNEPEPKRAELIAIKTPENPSCLLLVRKSPLPGKYTYDNAQHACSGFRIPGTGDLIFRCPTRKECIDINDALSCGLYEAIRITGGTLFMEQSETYRIWTSEKDSESWRWFSELLLGRIDYTGELALHYVVPVTKMETEPDKEKGTVRK